MRLIGRCALATLAVVVLGACSGPSSDVDRDLGFIDETQSFADRINWPGTDHGSGRQIPFIRGFAHGRPHAYWFLGFASRKTADSFWFCREGDDLCPLDENRRLNWDTLVGHPLFMRVPGQPGFSPFWQMWVVRVPDDYEGDSVKTIDTLHRMELDGEVQVEPVLLDFETMFGRYFGPQEVVLHCALVLQGTTLAAAGEEMPDGSGLILVPERKFGWHEGYRVEFIDFTPSDGVFPEATDSESRPLMPFANIYIHWRSCESDPRPAICDIPGYALSNRRPVSERGLGQDLTGDRDPDDTNNVLGALPCELQREAEPLYSPLWRVNLVQIKPGVDVGLIDSYADQAESDIQSSDDIFRMVDEGLFMPPVPQTEDETGNPIPGNEGQLFFSCPSPVRVGQVPYPCAGE